MSCEPAGDLGVDGREEACPLGQNGVKKDEANGDGALPQGVESTFLPPPPWSTFAHVSPLMQATLSPHVSPLMQATLSPGEDWKTHFPLGFSGLPGTWDEQDPAIVHTKGASPLEEPHSGDEEDPAYITNGSPPAQLLSDNEKLAMDNARLIMENQLLRSGYGANPAWSGAVNSPGSLPEKSPVLSYWSGDSPANGPSEMDMAAWAGMGMSPFYAMPYPMMPMGPGMWPMGAGGMSPKGGPQKGSRARTDSDVGLQMGRTQTGPSSNMGRSRTLSDVHDLHAVGEAYEGPYTTVMLRNLPNNYSRTMLLKLIDAEGFGGQYDLVYLPMDFKSHASLGYAFVNLATSDQAQRFFETFEGFHRWVVPSQKVCSVNWSHPYQGLDAHIERYRNSPVMHEDVPDDYKPMVFRDGKRIPFPPPTKKLKVPRMRPGHDKTLLPDGTVAEE